MTAPVSPSPTTTERNRTDGSGTASTSRVLTESQLRDYQRDGFLVLRGAIDDADVCRYEEGFARNPPLDGTLDTGGATYPAPGRYTLAQSCLKDPDLAPLAEHSTITSAAADVLGGDPRLTAFVIYDRTPGGPPIPSHNDYKRWRPVGSSMNWAFTIVPFCDFDAAAGQLFVAPGSHRLDRITVGRERPFCVAPPIKPEESAYVDPELRRGDLLVMNMHLWHRAAGNSSNHHRVGAFNKYTAADAPPATGYFLYDDDVHTALSPENRQLLAVHSDKPIATTRLLLVRRKDDEPQVFVVDADVGPDEASGPRLPGGPTFVEQAIPDWDRGNMIAALQASLREQIRIETPWVSYLGDFDEGGDHLCRVYGYELTGLGFPVAYDQGRWLTRSQLESSGDEIGFGYELDALDRWLDPTIVRGKGLTQAQSRVNQYAY
jgi:ectoine hydroxylase-related dioxygenase (phytanoyl-CoA dioxygenase family)